MTQRARPRVWALTLPVCVVGCASPATKTSDTPIASGEPPPRFATGGPNAEELGARMGYPKGTPATFWRAPWQVGSFSHFDEIFRGRLIHKASTPSCLVRVAEPRITWTPAGADLSLDDYLSRNPTTGLLIARGGTIFIERYQYGRTDRHRFTSFSMAKTVTAMLIGIAIDEGRIRSVDDLAAAYVPALAGTEYGRTSLRHLLQMSSGVRFWVQAATTVHPDQSHLSPGTATPTDGYGYQTWILPGERKMFMLHGTNGQRIYVDPRSKLVMVNTSVSKPGLDLFSLHEMTALWTALVRQLGDDHR